MLLPAAEPASAIVNSVTDPSSLIIAPVKTAVIIPKTTAPTASPQLPKQFHAVTNEALSDLLTAEKVKAPAKNSALACQINAEVKTFTRLTQNLNPLVLKLALQAYQCAIQHGITDDKHFLTVIDYSLPSYEKRLWVIDLAHNKILFNSLVAHGKNSGKVTATQFSDSPKSDESSVGLFRTEEQGYVGKDGIALRLTGLEAGFNDKVYQRAVVIHGAWYVSDKMAKAGAIGRSWGCPAVPRDMIKPLVDTIKNGTLIFAYAEIPEWLKNSKFINCRLQP